MTHQMPRLERIELHRIEVPLVRPFETSFGRETVREVLLVKAVTDTGEGWGECVAGRDPFYSGEYVAGAASVIERYLGPALLDRAKPILHVAGALRIDRFNGRESVRLQIDDAAGGVST